MTEGRRTAEQGRLGPETVWSCGDPPRLARVRGEGPLGTERGAGRR